MVEKTIGTYPLVYIIVLCHNSKKWLEECIRSLFKTKYNNLKILLVDNVSTDGSVDEIEKKYPDLLITRNSKNEGWCRGNNIGIEKAIKAGAEYIVFLNSDIKAEQEEWLSNLVEFDSRNPKYGILGCTQYEYDSQGWDELNSCTKYILFNGNRDVFFMWDSLFKEDENTKVYSEADIDNQEFLECYFVQGAAMMIRTELINKIGMFDDIYFIFYDEVDFCRRARMVGSETALITNSKIKHVGSGDNYSNKKNQRRRNFLFSRNKYIFLLTDVERSKLNIFNIGVKLLKNDVKDAFGNKQDVSNFLQLIHIVSSLLFKMIPIATKRKRHKMLISSNLTSVIENAQ
jgi:GT2 family glycosyltransferase